MKNYHSPDYSLLYGGIVEYSKDPLGLGRVRVRVPILHGLPEDVAKEQAIPTDRLPWAQKLEPFTGPGAGMNTPLLPGTMVKVMFEGADPTKPIVVGCIYSAPSQTHEWGNPQDAQGKPSMGRFKHRGGNPEVPSEAQSNLGADPQSYLFKSGKGAALHMQDRDGAEQTSLLDRAGQGLVLEASVQTQYNQQNANSRDLNSWDDSSAIDVSKLNNRMSWLGLGDCIGQFLEMVGRKGSEVLRLVSKSKQGRHLGTDYVCLELSNSKSHALIRIVKGGATVANIDVGANSIDIVANSITLSAQSVNVSGNLTVSGTFVAPNSKCQQQS